MTRGRPHFVNADRSVLSNRTIHALLAVGALPHINMQTSTESQPTTVSHVIIRLPQLRHSRLRTMRSPWARV